jgi:hypothetical protein
VCARIASPDVLPRYDCNLGQQHPDARTGATIAGLVALRNALIEAAMMQRAYRLGGFSDRFSDFRCCASSGSRPARGSFTYLVEQHFGLGKIVLNWEPP